jgi:hypothetical protein
MVVRNINTHRDRRRMPHSPEPADLEAQIEALIRQAGNSRRQQLDEVHRDNDIGSAEARELHRRPPDPRERLPWWRLFFKVS